MSRKYLGILPTQGDNNPNILTTGYLEARLASFSGGSIVITDDGSTNTDYYPVFATANSGNLVAKVDSSKLRYNPSTETLTVGTLIAKGTGTPASFSNSEIIAYDTYIGFLQIVAQNLSNNTNASTDFVATADTGTDSINYIDLGINSSTYVQGSWTINGALDGYLYTQSSNLAIGTATAGKNLVLFTGGTLTANTRLTLSDTAITPNVPITLPASQGIIIASGAPGTLTNTLYQIGGNLYFNGSQLAAGGTNVHSGTAIVDFGSAPGNMDAKVTITGLTGILTSSIPMAAMLVKDSADHSADEHWIEGFSVTCGNIIAGTSFDIIVTPTFGLAYGKYNVVYTWI